MTGDAGHAAVVATPAAARPLAAHDAATNAASRHRMLAVQHAHLRAPGGEFRQRFDDFAGVVHWEYQAAAGGHVERDSYDTRPSLQRRGPAATHRRPGS